MSRRMVVFDFNSRIPVNQKNTHLAEELKKELPILIRKTTEAYLWARQVVGTTDIQTILPQYFKQTNKNMKLMVNKVSEFIATRTTRSMITTTYVPIKIIYKKFQEWLRESYRLQSSNKDKKNYTEDDLIAELKSEYEICHTKTSDTIKSVTTRRYKLDEHNQQSFERMQLVQQSASDDTSSDLHVQMSSMQLVPSSSTQPAAPSSTLIYGVRWKNEQEIYQCDYVKCLVFVDELHEIGVQISDAPPAQPEQQA